MPSRFAEYVVLRTLKQCRAEMIQDFLDHKPEIYAPSYKYEKSLVLMKLAREKYFTTWLSIHWQVFNDIIKHCSDNERQQAESVFSKTFLELLNKWVVIKRSDSAQLKLGLQLVEDMQVALKQFIDAGEKADVMNNKLHVALEKNKVLFDREIIKMGGGLS